MIKKTRTPAKADEFLTLQFWYTPNGARIGERMLAFSHVALHLEVRAALTKVGDRLQFAGAPEEMQTMALSARTKAHDLQRAMKQAGAADPMEGTRWTDQQG